MNRHRETGAITCGSATYTSLGINGQADVNYASTSSPTGSTKTMDDVVTPNFRKLIAQGAIIINPVTSVTRKASASPKSSVCVYSPASNLGTAKGFYGDSLSDVIGCYHGNVPPPAASLPDWSAYELSLAVTDAWSKVASPDAMSLVSALEARETMKFLLNGAKVLTVKAGPFQQLKDQWLRGKLTYSEFRHRVGDAWLAYRYGAMPLLYDIQGHLKALSSGVSYTSIRERATATRTSSFSSTLAGPGGSNTLRTMTSQWSISGTHKYRAGVIYSAGHGRLQDAGITVEDVIPSIWEGVRLSFVVDWAFNIGKYLQGWSGYAKVNCLGAWKSVTTESTAVLTYSETAGKYVGTQKGPLYSSLTTDGSGATLTYESKRVVRMTSDIYDMGLGPTLSLNTKRVVDAFFLLSNALDVNLQEKSIRRGVGRTLLRI